MGETMWATWAISTGTQICDVWDLCFPIIPSTRELKSIQHRSRNQLTKDSHSTSNRFTQSFAKQPHTPDLEIYLWNQQYDTINHTSKSGLISVFNQTAVRCYSLTLSLSLRCYPLPSARVSFNKKCNSNGFKCDHWCQTRQFQPLRNGCHSSSIMCRISRDWCDKHLQSWGHNRPCWWRMSERLARLIQVNKYSSETSWQWHAKGQCKIHFSDLQVNGPPQQKTSQLIKKMKLSTRSSALDSRLERRSWSFCGYMLMKGSEMGINGINGSNLPAVKSTDCWWGDDVGNVFLAHIRPD